MNTTVIMAIKNLMILIHILIILKVYLFCTGTGTLHISSDLKEPRNQQKTEEKK